MHHYVHWTIQNLKCNHWVKLSENIVGHVDLKCLLKFQINFCCHPFKKFFLPMAGKSQSSISQCSRGFSQHRTMYLSCGCLNVLSVQPSWGWPLSLFVDFRAQQSAEYILGTCETIAEWMQWWHWLDTSKNKNTLCMFLVRRRVNI